ncbi:MAG: LysE family translocator [Pseudomonadota bacterium]|nr:LysE family translocator [Pseudomonadota bacterium]
MIQTTTLFLFCGTLLALLVSPGPNMAFLLSHGISDGVRGGLAVALGIFVADLVMTALTATGVTAVVAAWPPLFDVLRYLGAGYLVWLAIQAMRPHAPTHLRDQVKTSSTRIFRMAVLNSLLNPKALLFFMVFLPQFVNPAAGHIPLQIAILGLVLCMMALLFHATLAATSGRIATLFARSARYGNLFRWMHACLFVGLALRLLLLEKPTPR